MDLQMIGGKMMIDNSIFRSDDIWCIFEVPFSWTNPKGPTVQCDAPKIAKLVYNSNNYGLWYL